MDKELSEKLFSQAKALGADLVSACAVEQMLNYPGAKEEIGKLEPKAKSLLVIGIRMVSSSLACSPENRQVPQFSTKLLYEELARVLFGLMRELDDSGKSAVPLPTYLPVPMKESTKGLIAELSLRHIAYEAGLGSIGKNRLLISPQFGPRVRFGAILTDAELVPGKPVAENFCTDCDLCVESCPTGALKSEGQAAIAACAKHHMQYGLPGLIRFGIKYTKAKSDDEKINLLRSPEFWEFWQSLNTGVFYHCFDCLNACPIGK